MIDILQSLTSAKPNIPIPFIEKPAQTHLLSFIHALSSQATILTSSRQPTLQITNTPNENGFSGSRKLTKALSDPPIFTDGNNPSIN